MIKVQIPTRCEACDGEAYLLVGEAVSGEVYTCYEPCPACQGSGNVVCWISLGEFLDFLKDEAAIGLRETDWQELDHLQPIGQYQDSRDAVGIYCYQIWKRRF